MAATIGRIDPVKYREQIEILEEIEKDFYLSLCRRIRYFDGLNTFESKCDFWNKRGISPLDTFKSRIWRVDRKEVFCFPKSDLEREYYLMWYLNRRSEIRCKSGEKIKEFELKKYATFLNEFAVKLRNENTREKVAKELVLQRAELDYFSHLPFYSSQEKNIKQLLERTPLLKVYKNNDADYLSVTTFLEIYWSKIRFILFLENLLAKKEEKVNYLAIVERLINANKGKLVGKRNKLLDELLTCISEGVGTHSAIEIASLKAKYSVRGAYKIYEELRTGLISYPMLEYYIEKK